MFKDNCVSVHVRVRQDFTPLLIPLVLHFLEDLWGNVNLFSSPHHSQAAELAQDVPSPWHLSLSWLLGTIVPSPGNQLAAPPPPEQAFGVLRKGHENAGPRAHSATHLC